MKLGALACVLVLFIFFFSHSSSLNSVLQGSRRVAQAAASTRGAVRQRCAATRVCRLSLVVAHAIRVAFCAGHRDSATSNNMSLDKALHKKTQIRVAAAPFVDVDCLSWELSFFVSKAEANVIKTRIIIAVGWEWFIDQEGLQFRTEGINFMRWSLRIDIVPWAKLDAVTIVRSVCSTERTIVYEHVCLLRFRRIMTRFLVRTMWRKSPNSVVFCNSAE